MTLLTHFVCITDPQYVQPDPICLWRMKRKMTIPFVFIYFNDKHKQTRKSTTAHFSHDNYHVCYFNSHFMERQKKERKPNKTQKLWSHGVVSNPTLCWQTKPNMTRTVYNCLFIPFLIQDHNHNTATPQKNATHFNKRNEWKQRLSACLLHIQCILSSFRLKYKQMKKKQANCHTTTLFMAGMINALVIVFVSTLTGLFHTAAEYMCSVITC